MLIILYSYNYRVSNLNGIYTKPNSLDVGSITWGNLKSIKSVQMMVRPQE